MLKEEIGGIAIYLDLLSSLLNIGMQDAITFEFNRVSKKYDLGYYLNANTQPIKEDLVVKIKELREFAKSQGKEPNEDILYGFELGAKWANTQPIKENPPAHFADSDNWQLELIGRAEKRFNELEEKKFDWRSFYHGWLEGRFDMMKNKVKENPPIDNKKGPQ
jgi:hypothetical protein